MKLRWLALSSTLLLFFVAPLRAQTKFDVFGGYSYFHASVSETGTLLCPGPPCPTKAVGANPNLNGWEGSVAYKFADSAGVVADFGGAYGSLPANLGGGSMHTNTYLFGPQVSLPARISPFAHVLLGVAHESIASGVSGGFTFPGRSENAFTMALGGGIDVRVLPAIWARLIQVDYLGSHFPSSLQNQARVSAGVVFHF